MAHGLVLKLEEMLQRNLVAKKDEYEVFSEEEKVINSWLVASADPKFYKLEFLRRLRRTLLLVLSPISLQESRKNVMHNAITMYFNKIPNMPKYSKDMYKPLIEVIHEPWKNDFFSWDEFFQKKISYADQIVQEYFAKELEEIAMARIHCLVHQGKEEMAMTLAKNSFLYHSRVTKSFYVSTRNSSEAKQKSQSVLSKKYVAGTASLDWYLFILQRKKSLPFMVNEMNQLSCHEGVQLIHRLRRNKRHSFAFGLLQILLMQDLVKPSAYCCTKKIFSLWCIMHKERKSGGPEINLAVRKMLAMYAPSSAHFYLFVDALWEQFGTRFITLYVELYVRGLTVDINYLEAARNGEVQDDVGYLECHIASMFNKLSTLFSDFHEGAARECMFSAFSLKPTKERLYILQSLTHSILSSENEMKLNFSVNGNLSILQECKCDVRCNGSCKGIKEYYLDHPILKKGISNVPYILVKDLVCVLEGVRCTRFQYNVFDWHNNATDLGDYLKDFTLLKSWESDTEYASEGSNRSDIDELSPIKDSSNSPQINSKYITNKRKSESSDPREMFALDVGANIEVSNEEGLSKRIKTLDQNINSEVDKEAYNKQIQPIQNLNSLGMEDAIENVIRMTLDNNKQKSDISLSNNYLNTSLNCAHDGTQKLSLSYINKYSSENHVYPYSLTPCGEKNHLSSSFRSTECVSSVKSNLESSNKITSTASKSSDNYPMPPIFVTRESVISPTLSYHESSKQSTSYKFFANKSTHQADYGNGKGNATSMGATNKKAPVYHQKACNHVSVGNYEQMRSAQNTVTQSSQTVSNKAADMKFKNKPVSSIQPSDLSKIQFLPIATIPHPNSITSVNVIQSKETLAMQHPVYPSTSQCVSNTSIYRSDSRFQLDGHSNISNTVVKRIDQSVSCFQENQVMHSDRSSVIQHTMQHIRESSNQHELCETEIPNRLAVSVNSNAAQQIRNVPKEDIANLPPFTVSVSDKTISNASLAVSASLVIARKPQSQGEVSSQPVCSSITTSSNNDTITIPGILASPSVIVTPWETQHKNHGKLMYKKNANAVSTTSIDRRIYKYRTPYSKQLVLKPEPKMPGQASSANEKNCQILKAIAPSSHIKPTLIAVPSVNQNNANSSQVWSVVNKASSTQTQGIPQTTSSQPWYSEPYPKPHKNENSQSAGSLNTAVEQSASVIKSFQPNKPVSSVKSFTTYYKQPSQIHAQNLPLPPVVSHSLNNTIPGSSTKLSEFCVPSSGVSSHTVSHEHLLHKETISVASSSQSNTGNAKVFSTQSSHGNDSQLLNQCIDASQYMTAVTENKSPISFTAANVADPKLCHISSKFLNSCCSPTEINPCQNCSLPPEVKLEPTSQLNMNNPEQPAHSSREMMPDQVLTSNCDTKLMSDVNGAADLMFSDMNETLSVCPYCSNSFLESELEMHVFNNHSKEFSVKNNFVTDIDSKMLPENACSSVKSLSDVVPEQESPFHRESFQTDLPHTKAVASSEDNQNINEDDRNFDDIEANAFNACMDLINNDKDLKRIVQGIDSFGQIENNYMPFMPVTGSSNNFLNSNVCNEIQKTDLHEIPLQNLPKAVVSNEHKVYIPQFESLRAEKNNVNPTKSLGSVFEFTEKDYEASKPAQNLVFKNKTNIVDKAVDNIKDPNELTFSALTEMIRGAIDDSNNEHHLLERCANDSNESMSYAPINPQKTERVVWSCVFCSKDLRSSATLRRHIHKLHPEIHIEDWKSVLQPKRYEMLAPNAIDHNAQLQNDIALNSVHTDSNGSLNAILCTEVKQNQEISSTSGIGTLQGKVKSPCRICGKYLTSVYLKKHIQTQHNKVSIKIENSSSDLNVEGHNSSASQLEVSSFTTASVLPEQDIDSSTCLSVSDALKRNISYTVTGVSSPSDGSEKVTEEADVKFSFNVLEFSKDTKVDTSKEYNDLMLKIKTCASPDNANKDEENKIKANVTYSRKCRLFLHKHQCHLCSKVYSSIASFRKHLKSMHNVSNFPRAPRKNKVLNNMQKLESESEIIETHHPPTSNVPQVNVEPKSSLLNKGTSVQQLSSEMSDVARADNLDCAGNSVSKSIEQHKRSVSYLNCNLLKAVLKSNFVSKQIKENDLKLSNEIGSCENIQNAFPSSGTPENCPEQLAETNHLSTYEDSKCSSSNSLVDTVTLYDYKAVTSVPSQEREMTKEGFAPLSEENQCNVTSISKSNYVHLENMIHESDINLQTSYPNLMISTHNAGSQNLNIQSNEISSVSEIISNISKCQFVGTPNNDNERELFEDNSLKLLIPENQKESVNDIDEKSKNMQPVTSEQNSVPKQGIDCVNDANDTTVNSDVLFCDVKDAIIAPDSYNKIDVVEDMPVVEAELCEEVDVNCTSDRNEKKCRLCHQGLSSMDSLSKHLKLIHDIPVLKRHISQLDSSELTQSSHESEKLSPPKLKLGTSDSDSESVSDSDNLRSSLKTSNDSFELDVSQNEMAKAGEDSNPSQSLFSENSQKENTSNTLACKLQLSNSMDSTNVKQSNSVSESFNPFLFNSDLLKQMTAISSSRNRISRRHSFSDDKSFYTESKKIVLENLQEGNGSLPNLEVIFKHKLSECPKFEKRIKLLSCTSTELSWEGVEQSSLSSATGVNEDIKIADDSNFSKPNSLLNSSVTELPSSRLKVKARISCKKLIQRFKSYNREKRFKKKVKAKYLKNFKPRKTYKPFILTLKEATEISEFLKTHKQPIVKLIRLKENESSFLLNKKDDSVLHKMAKNCAKKAVVKLERMNIPRNFGNLLILNQNLTLSNLLSRDSNSHDSVSMQNNEKQSESCLNDSQQGSSEIDFSQSEVSTIDENISDDSVEIIEVKNFDSDTVLNRDQCNLIEETCSVETECHTLPLKECSVILERISV